MSVFRRVDQCDDIPDSRTTKASLSPSGYRGRRDRRSEPAIATRAIPSESKLPIAQQIVGAIQFFDSEDESWRPLPAWAAFFVLAGAWLGSQDEDIPIVLAIAVPTRAFAATLCTVGVVMGRADTPVEQDVEERLAQLRSLPPNAPVWYRESVIKRRQAMFLRVEQVSGRELAVIQLALPGAPGATFKVQCLKVEPAENLSSAPNRQARARASRVGLLASSLDSQLMENLLRASRLDALIVGNRKRLEEEIKATEFAVPVRRGRWTRGHLQDLLRAKRFQADGECYRCDVIPGVAAFSSVDGSRPRAVVFDGSAPFLKWGKQWPAAHRIVIMDRHDARFEDAQQEINQLYVADRCERLSLQKFPKVPGSVECMVFGIGAP